MTKVIAYFLYSFGNFGANMLKSLAVNKMSSHIPNDSPSYWEWAGYFYL